MTAEWWICLGIGCALGLAPLISGTISAARTDLDGTVVFLTAFIVSLFSVVAWPLTLVGLTAMCIADHRAVNR